MAGIPEEIDTAQQPPMAIPLRHFVVGIGLLLLGGMVGLGVVLGMLSGLATLAHVHLLLVGWICVTIMGAMTQFVPVWSGVPLHSRRLATWQLWLATAGLLGFVAGLVTARLWLLAPFGVVMLLGFWTFVYNLGRTLWTLPTYDVTERHFGLALGFFVLVTAFGVVLAIDLVEPVVGRFSVTRQAFVQTHATLAVFGAVLTTILGALYQLATMFTQTELRGVDRWLQRLEAVAYPLGVVSLAGGRLLQSAVVARFGGALVVLSLIGVGVILARRLYESRVPWTPMLRRYAVVPPALVLWGLITFPVWVAHPLRSTVTFGAPGSVHLLGLGVIGFVVLGTLYHVIPFIIWVHRYSDRLGFEQVPMIDDLYSTRVAHADFVLLALGTGWLILADLVATLPGPAWGGGALVVAGTGLFAANVLLVVYRHGPADLVVGWLPVAIVDHDR